MQPLTYTDIVALEPQIKEVEALVRQYAGSQTYGPWYRIVKPAFKFLVGFMSLHTDPRLRTSEAYDVVYRHLLVIYECQPMDGVMPPVATPISSTQAEPGQRICPTCGQNMRDAESCGGEDDVPGGPEAIPVMPTCEVKQ